MTTKDSEKPEPQVDTANEFMLGMQGNVISPRFFPYLTTRQQAYRFAAWCALMGEQLPNEPLPDHPDGHSLQEIVQAIKNT